MQKRSNKATKKNPFSWGGGGGQGPSSVLGRDTTLEAALRIYVQLEEKRDIVSPGTCSKKQWVTWISAFDSDQQNETAKIWAGRGGGGRGE